METPRVQRLRMLLADTFAGSQTEMAKRLGMSTSQIGQYFCGYRNIGEKVARRIEQASGKPLGWLDGVDLSESALSADTGDNRILHLWREASPEAKEVAQLVLAPPQNSGPHWLREDLRQALDSMLYAAMRWQRDSSRLA